MKNDYYVYAHINPINDEVFYVGKGRGRRAYIKYGRNDYWNKYVKKYGRLVMFIKINITEKESFEIEKKWINIFGRKNLGKGTLINLTDGGEGISGIKPFNGKKHSKESKLKMSKAKKGKPSNNLGKKLSEEHKLKISICNKGKTTHNAQKIIIDGVEYSSLSQASNILKYSRKFITKRLKSLDYPNYQYKK